MITYACTLGAAHKLLDQLKAAVRPSESARARRYGMETATPVGVVRYPVTAAGLTTPDVLADVQAQVASAEAAFILRLALGRDLARVREAIFAANQRTGASQHLATLSTLTAEQQLFAEVRKSLVDAPGRAPAVASLTAEWLRQIAEVAATSTNTPDPLILSTWTLPALDARLRDLRRAQHETEDLLRQCNAQRLTLSLEEATADAVGIVGTPGS